MTRTADLGSGPELPNKLVKDWAQLPPGWNFGDSVWVFNRGAHPVIQFDKSGKVLQPFSTVFTV